MTTALPEQWTDYDATLARYAPPTFVGLGDSISADGGRVVNSVNGKPSTTVSQYSWHFLGQMLADSRAIWAGTYGAASQTTAQIKNLYLPFLLGRAIKPKYAVLLASQNDGGASSLQVLADYRSIVDQLIRAGIKPILCTITPTSTGINFIKMNAFIRNLSYSYGLPLLDLYTTVVDSTTGVWQASLTRDGIHPNNAGANAMGNALAALLMKLEPYNFAEAWLPKTEQGFSLSRTGTGGVAHPLFLTPNGASPPVIAGEMAVLNGSYATATAFNTASGVIGNKVTMTCGATSPLIVRSFIANGTGQAGDQYLIACRLSATVNGGAGWALGVINDVGSSLYDVGRNTSTRQGIDLSNNIFLTWIRTTTTGIYLDYLIETTGASISVSELATYNLTGMGQEMAAIV